MSNYIYTVEEHTSNGIKTQTFEGFQRFTEEKNKLSNTIAIVPDYDEIEIWDLSGDINMAVEELTRIYRMRYHITPTVHLYQKIVD